MTGEQLLGDPTPGDLAPGESTPELQRATPITPEEAESGKQIPEAVINVFNRFISEKILDGRAVVDQDDVVRELEAAGLSGQDIFRKGWLNIEGLYQRAGWKVEYNRPGYNESGRSFFTFSTKSKSPRRDPFSDY
jgi:hypothetical protein